ncbi:DeoR family transcriptional regulator [Chitinophaga skermanii]|uniref:DeoR family transcriptional regulator n=1 Tax=Chitinophaga skermanii TaxID=331697 RepID=A0A327QM90_9BACT|nr:DeoR/GlpR family DNA-binding transcription regulator [Chitinophaga skermanii]RAJ05450.1 DeoR family transcriptional regulator [Chitinophaga skermanii]
MIKEERFDYILQKLKMFEQITYEQLAISLDVSEDTIRRDVDHLYRNGLLSKIRGGAMLPSKNPLTFQDRSTFLTEQKDLIALKAIPFLKPGMTVFMDGGTTITAIGNSIPLNLSLRIITNNVPLIPLLEKNKNIEIIVLGGEYNRESATNTGMVACNQASKYLVDLYLMGTCGVDPRFGITANSDFDGNVKRTMFENARQTISLANHSRLHASYNYRVCRFEEIDTLITDLDSNHPDLAAFRDNGVQIV